MTWGKWVPPTLDEAILFLTSEVGEVCDAYLRDYSFERNNLDKEVDIEEELADVLFMVYVCAITRGFDIDRKLRDKLSTTRLPDDAQAPAR